MCHKCGREWRAACHCIRSGRSFDASCARCCIAYDGDSDDEGGTDDDYVGCGGDDDADSARSATLLL